VDKSQISSLLEGFELALIESILGKIALEQFLKGKISKNILLPFAEKVKSLSDEYNREERVETEYVDVSGAEAYALYYAPINFAKMLYLFSKLPSTIFEKDLKVLDFGCGPGTAAFSLAAYTDAKLSVTCLDSSDEMLSVAKKINQNILNNKISNINFIKELNSESSFDLIMLPNVLNELDNKMELIHELFPLLNPGGILLILEPALKEITRNSMSLRDGILKLYPELAPIFPCTHRNDCPMLKRSEKDWCHTTLNWDAPKLVKHFDELTGFNKHRIKFSGFAFQKGAKLLSGYRVVDQVTKNKIGWSTLLCGEPYYGNVRLLRRNRSPDNKEFEGLKIYDRVEINTLLNSGDISKDQNVKVMKSSDL